MYSLDLVHLEGVKTALHLRGEKYTAWGITATRICYTPGPFLSGWWRRSGLAKHKNKHLSRKYESGKCVDVDISGYTFIMRNVGLDLKDGEKTLLRY